MHLSSYIISTILYKRRKAIDAMRQHPIEIQGQQFTELMKIGENSIFFEHHALNENTTYEQFRKEVPIVCYEQFAPWVERSMSGENHVLTNVNPLWAAKSSGTTNSKSKIIPINEPSLQNCHYRGAKDVIVSCVTARPDTLAYSGSSLTLGGSQDIYAANSNIKIGDLSAILIDNTPEWVRLIREPKPEIALISDFEQKIEAIAKNTVSKNITSFAGVPSWNLVLMRKILEHTGKRNLLEVWPNLSLFMHGGIAFEPYRKQFQEMIPLDDMIYLETYNASEGFFAIQDDLDDPSMMLMLDYGTFYEFIPMKTLDDHTTAVTLEGVQVGVNYAMVISTIGGLWRYLIGDTVMFTSTNPYKILITGRTKHYINAFGEELMVGNADTAITKTCDTTGAIVNNYTVAPMFMQTNTKGAHQWLVEFETMPNCSVGEFAAMLDGELRKTNSDYAAKRENNATMDELTLTMLGKGTFVKWMTAKGKLGGQNKVPKLSPTREYVDDILEYNTLK